MKLRLCWGDLDKPENVEKVLAAIEMGEPGKSVRFPARVHRCGAPPTEYVVTAGSRVVGVSRTPHGAERIRNGRNYFIREQATRRASCQRLALRHDHGSAKVCCAPDACPWRIEGAFPGGYILLPGYRPEYERDGANNKTRRVFRWVWTLVAFAANDDTTPPLVQAAARAYLTENYDDVLEIAKGVDRNTKLARAHAALCDWVSAETARRKPWVGDSR